MKAYKKYFKHTLDAHFPEQSEPLLSDIETTFHALEGDIRFASASKNPMDKRLGIAAYFLALIKVLEKKGESYEQIREISLEIARNYVQPKNRFQAMMKRLPVKLIGTRLSTVLLKYLDRKLSDRGHPEGFVSRIITDKNETYGLGYGVDILECGICKLFAKHNYSPYTSILCEIDFITTNLAGLQLVRSGTIANGADTCDFRFKVNQAK